MSLSQTLVAGLHRVSKGLPPFRGKQRLFGALYDGLALDPREDFRVTMKHSATPVLARLGSGIERQLLCQGAYDPAEMALLARLVQPGWTCLDVGANVGYYTVRLAELAGPAGRVLAFEPYDTVLARLEANVRTLPQVTVVPCAVGDVVVRARMAVNADDEPNVNATLAEVPSDHPTTREVPVRTLDDVWSRELSGGPVHLAKLDIEGYEFKALLGGRRMIGACKPSLLMEYNRPYARIMGFDLGALLALLREFAPYEAHLVRPGGRLVRLEGDPVRELVNVLLRPAP